MHRAIDGLENQRYEKDLYDLQRLLGARDVKEALSIAKSVCARLSPYGVHYQVRDPLIALDRIEKERDDQIKQWAEIARDQREKADRAEARADKAELELRSLAEASQEERLIQAGVPKLVVAFYQYCQDNLDIIEPDLPSFLSSMCHAVAKSWGLGIREYFGVNSRETRFRLYRI